MKLIRFGAIGYEKPGVQLTDGTKIDVSSFGSDYNEEFFGDGGITKLSNWLVNNQNQCPKIGSEVRLGVPLVRPSKIVCVGLNYAKHAAESGMEFLKNPYCSLKQPLL